MGLCRKTILLLIFSSFITLGFSQVSLIFENVDIDTGTLDIYMINQAGCSYCDNPDYNDNTQDWSDQKYACEYNADSTWVAYDPITEEECSAISSLTGDGGWWFDGEVGGFQFELIGITITGASAPAGFMVNTSPTAILGFSLTGATIQIGESVLTLISFSSYSDNYICFGEDTGTAGTNIISDVNANYIAADWGDCYGNYTLGCTELLACNYNPDATVDDGSCSYSEENYDCDGNCAVEIDCAGECGGYNELDSADECCESWYQDCSGICFGNAVIDCLGNCGGSAVIDECGVCEGDGVWQVCGCGSPDEFGIPDGDCDCDGNVVDCAGLCGENSVCLSIENVNIVSNILNITMINNQSVGGFQFTLDGIDIESVSGGSSAENSFSIATNPQMILGFEDSANSIPAGDGVLTSIYFSNYVGGDICFGSEPEKNIISDEFGYELYSIWGDCYISTEDCDTTYDCAGECGGSAELDECGVCGGDGIAEGTCDCDGNVQDCAGVCGGDATAEDCDACTSGVFDCIGACDGSAELDECGVCDGDGAIYECGCADIPEGECDCAGNVQDCTGVCDGSAELDECGECGGDGPADGFDCDGESLSLFNGLIPEDFSISNIYPNPFNPTTNIIYELPGNNTVKVSVYDLNGQIIRHLVNEFQTAGYYTISWDADNLPSGLYFIHMQSGSLYHTRKVVLLK